MSSGIGVYVRQVGDFSPKMGIWILIPRLGLDVFRKIVRHELCHYHLYFQGKGYQHKDRDFKELLKAVDGLRFVPSLPNSNSKAIKLYRCQSCQQTYQRKRRIDTQRYRCGLCRGKLLLVNQPED